MVKRFYKVDELSELIGMSKNTIRSWIWLKKIPYYKFGRTVKFDIKEINKWIEQNKVKTVN